jgi:hypothetical protein
MAVARWVSLLVIAAIYGLSLALPAIYLDEQEGSMLGIACLAVVPISCAQGGWMALVLWYWWANPLFLVGCILFAFKRDLAARCLAILAFGLAASFLTLGGEGLRPGFYAWLASMTGLFVVTFVPKAASSTRKPDKIHDRGDLFQPAGLGPSVSKNILRIFTCPLTEAFP